MSGRKTPTEKRNKEKKEGEEFVEVRKKGQKRKRDRCGWDGQVETLYLAEGKKKNGWERAASRRRVTGEKRVAGDRKRLLNSGVGGTKTKKTVSFMALRKRFRAEKKFNRLADGKTPKHKNNGGGEKKKE